MTAGEDTDLPFCRGVDAMSDKSTGSKRSGKSAPDVAVFKKQLDGIDRERQTLDVPLIVRATEAEQRGGRDWQDVPETRPRTRMSKAGTGRRGITDFAVHRPRIGNQTFCNSALPTDWRRRSAGSSQQCQVHDAGTTDFCDVRCNSTDPGRQKHRDVPVNEHSRGR
jgi:hypothetical protein